MEAGLRAYQGRALYEGNLTEDALAPLVEKYGLDADAAGGGGGEYALQVGFGWTNGVTLKLLELYKPQPGAK